MPTYEWKKAGKGLYTRKTPRKGEYGDGTPFVYEGSVKRIHRDWPVGSEPCGPLIWVACNLVNGIFYAPSFDGKSWQFKTAKAAMKAYDEFYKGDFHATV